MTKPTEFLRVSYSSLNLFSSCARKFEFTKLYNRRAYDGDTFAADVGTALHHGYQNYLITRDEDKALWAMLESYPHESAWDQENDLRSLEAATITLQAMIDHRPMREWKVAEIRRPPTAEEIKTHHDYWHHQGISAIPEMPPVVVPAIEVPFELILNGITLPDGRGIAIVGFIDALMYNIMEQRYRTMDIKTHRRTLVEAIGKYKFDQQQLPYGIVLEHIQGKSIESFDVMYLDCFVDVAEPRIQDYTFKKDREAVQEWLLNTVLKCKQIQNFMEMNYFPRTDGGCISFNKPCWYLKPCEIRNKDMIQAWLLEGKAPEHRAPEIPWIKAELDIEIE